MKMPPNISLQRTARLRRAAAEAGSLGGILELCLLCVLTLLTTGCASARSGARPSAITEISLQRTECYGTCPVYTLVFHADGTATYHGGANSQMEGDWVGTFDKVDFSELAQLAETIGFFKFSPRYERMITDSPWAITAAVRGGQRYTVMNYAATGPLALSGFESAIDILATRAEWEQKK